MDEVNNTDPLHFYGSDAEHIRELMMPDRSLTVRLHPNLIYCKGEVIWAVRNEMAMTVEDVLARRTRSLFLDARAAMEAAPTVAELMAREMNKGEAWQREQVEAFNKIASGYLL
jgi:glycerol-3-phosphate dehydrogenase